MDLGPLRLWDWEIWKKCSSDRKGDKSCFILEPAICDHSLRTQIEVPAPLTPLKPCSNMVTVSWRFDSDEVKYKQRHFPNVRRKIRKAGYSNAKRTLLQAPDATWWYPQPLGWWNLEVCSWIPRWFTYYSQGCQVTQRWGINLTMTPYSFATCKSSELLWHILFFYIALPPFPH